MSPNLEPLLSAVQKNCHITDALHAGDYTLCVYLLKMREYYRWEKGFSFSTALSPADVGNWLREREQFWESLEHETFVDLPVNGDQYDPFDSDTLNRILNPAGFVYSAGMGQQGRPHFFLGRLEQQQTREDFTLLISADEYARDLAAPPAMAQGRTIFVRRESLRRMIWEKIEEWRWNTPDNAMGRAIHCYNFDDDTDAALHEMTEHQIDTVLLHEIGEVMAGAILGPAWEEMLADLPRSRAELSLRAVRDNLADSLSTLPQLIDGQNHAQIHFFFATLTPLRKALAPRLLQSYDDWLAHGTLQPLTDYCTSAQSHWRSVTERILDCHQRGGTLEEIQALIEADPL